MLQNHVSKSHENCISHTDVRNLEKILADQLEQHIGVLANEARSSLQDVCDEYGLEVGNKMANVSAKVYQPPLLEFAGNRQVMPLDRDGKGGNVNIKGNGFFKAADVGNFLIINCNTRANDQSINAMANALKNVGKNFGMKFKEWQIEQEIGLMLTFHIRL